MSFILDALKKSESDRQRQNGPALYEVKVAAPRSQLPYWAIGLAVLLGVNLVIVAWALLKRPSHPTAPEAAPALVAASPAPVAATPIQAAAPGPPAAVAPGSPPAQMPVPAAPEGPGANGSAIGPAAGASPGRADLAASRTAPRAPDSDAAGPPANPDDYAPAAEPTQSRTVGFHVRRATESGVPLYSEIASAQGGLPQLRLDLHAYAQKPEDRFVLINMKKLREGDSMPEGVKVESITPDGVVLSHNGSRFLLPRE